MSQFNYNVYKRETSYWWLVLLGGILLIAIGIFTILRPFQSYLSLSLVFAAGMVATGLFESFFCFANYKSVKGWGWILLGGLLDVFLGGYLFSYPLITMMVLPLIIGLWLLFRSIMSVGHALQFRAIGIRNWQSLMYVGFVTGVLAILVLWYPGLGITGLIFCTGIAFISAGVFRIYLSIKLKKINNY